MEVSSSRAFLAALAFPECPAAHRVREFSVETFPPSNFFCGGASSSPPLGLLASPPAPISFGRRCGPAPLRLQKPLGPLDESWRFARLLSRAGIPIASGMPLPPLQSPPPTSARAGPPRRQMGAVFFADPPDVVMVRIFPRPLPPGPCSPAPIPGPFDCKVCQKDVEGPPGKAPAP